MNSLREHMREHLTGVASTGPQETLPNFPTGATAPSRGNASAALDLVSQAAEVVRSIQDDAVESEIRTRALADSAIVKLQRAEARVHCSEAARSVVEETLSKLSGRLQEAERELTQARSRSAAIEIQLANAEQRIRGAETRAIDAEKAVNQIEDAIRIQLVGLQRTLTIRSARAA